MAKTKKTPFYNIKLILQEVYYSGLIKAESYVVQLPRDGKANEKSLQLAYHRALAHRMNFVADATWPLLGFAIAGIGIHGLVTIADKNNSSHY